jgi:hypothetical protein
MDIKELNAYRKGFINGVTTKDSPHKIMMFGIEIGELLDIVSNHLYGVKMAKNLKYQWCRSDAESDKEFLGWVYDRLQNKGDSLSDQHMRRLDEIVNTIWGTIPNCPPIIIDVTDSKPVIIKRHGKVIYNEVN